MIVQRTLPWGRWLAQHTPTCHRDITNQKKKPLRRHAGLVLELALLLILAVLLPGPKRRK